VRKSNLAVTYGVLLSAVLAFSVMQSLVLPVLAEISVRYDTDQATTTWVATAYLISASICTPLLGRLGDGFGRRRTLVACLVALAIGSLVAGLSSSIEVLLVARVVQGVGGGVLPLSYGIVRDEFPAPRVPSVVAALASTGAFGFAIGVAAGGPMVEYLGFRSLFLVPAGITAISALVALRFVPESPPRPAEPLPAVPALLLAGWLTALLLPVSKGAAWGWGSAATLSLLAVAIVLVVAWVVTESRAESPIIDMMLMRLRPIWSANLLSVMVGFAMFSSLALVPQLMQAPADSRYGIGASVTASGVALIPCGLACFLAGLVSVRVTRAFGSRVVLATALVAWACATYWMGMNGDTVLELALGMCVMGAGLGFLLATLAAAVVDAAPAHQTGAASGMHANLRTIGGAAGTAVTAAIVTSHPVTGFSASAVGYQTGFVVLAGVLFAAAPFTLMLPRLRARNVEPVPVRLT
jgi:EmrB/QacA subfamily drug resistance transporter